VGKAGQCHWSASFSNLVRNEPFRTVLLIEFACLCPAKVLPQVLRGTYEVADSIELESIGDEARILVANQELKIAPLSGDDWASECAVAARQLIVSPIRFPINEKKTVRWGYRLELSPVQA
jgi:hypothetical protein